MPPIRLERPGDIEQIHQVNLAAFGGEDEARLVDQLRADGDAIISLVAIEAETVVGHVLFSRLYIETNQGRTEAAALAPLAVRPDRQRRGIGAELTRAGLVACREQEIGVIVVLGDPAYYTRFGFSSEAAEGLEAPFSGDAFMALALSADLSPRTKGRVIYAAAFGLG